MNNKEVELQKLINVAIQSAILAGNIIVQNDQDDTATDDGFGGGGDKVQVWKQKANRRDLLTLMDPLCEKASLFVCLFLLIVMRDIVCFMDAPSLVAHCSWLVVICRTLLDFSTHIILFNSLILHILQQSINQPKQYITNRCAHDDVMMML